MPPMELLEFLKLVMTNHEAMVKIGYPEDRTFKVDVDYMTLCMIRDYIAKYAVIEERLTTTETVETLLEKLSAFDLPLKVGIRDQNHRHYEILCLRKQRTGEVVWINIDDTSYHDDD